MDLGRLEGFELHATQVGDLFLICAMGGVCYWDRELQGGETGLQQVIAFADEHVGLCPDR